MKNVWLGFSIDKSASVPVFEQICAEIRAQTRSGALPTGSRLPATRVLATELGVSRSTIVTAYDQLVAEGYLTSRPGSGYLVCALGEVELVDPGILKAPDSDQTAPISQPTPPVAFEAGKPDMTLFPYRQWAKTVARLCRTNPAAMLTGAPVFGIIDLRTQIADHVSEWRGIDATPQQVIITAGASDALSLCLATVSRPGGAIGLENPGYPPARRFAQHSGLQVVDLDLDDDGAQLPRAASPDLVMLTPSQQYPMGGAMSPSRRLAFINWAASNDAWIIEDDYDSEFRYAGRPIPAMAGFDQLHRTIYIGSFSKIFSGALRLGYIVLPTSLTSSFHAALRQSGARASLIPQQPLADFMASGEFYRHLRRMRRVYADRRRYLLDRLQTRFAEFGLVHDHQAGMQVVLHLRPPFQDDVIARKASAIGIEIEPLSSYCYGSKQMNGLIFGFCAYTPEEMGPALDQLVTLFRGTPDS